ncbi:MAG: hypothetical protein PHV52_08315 [Aliarcobacter sp.]|nr:hypothetical protein [Aliarcobacter sp.]
MLNNLNDKFINTPLKTKIELYLLPLLLLYLFYFLFNFEAKDDLSIQSKVNFDYSKNQFEESFLDLFSTLEDYASKNQIVIISLTNEKKIVFLKAKSTLENMQKFITKIENLNNFTKIKSFILNKQDENQYIFEIQIDLNRFYIKKIKKEVEIKHEEIKYSQNSREYKISGIISDYVFINDIWLKKDDNIDDLKLVQIGKDFVVLENENRKIILELNNEEYFKKSN